MPCKWPLFSNGVFKSHAMTALLGEIIIYKDSILQSVAKWQKNHNSPKHANLKAGTDPDADAARFRPPNPCSVKHQKPVIMSKIIARVPRSDLKTRSTVWR